MDEREAKIMQLCIERDRLIYWLLKLREGCDGVDRTLTAFGYRPDGNRAAQMLKLGEPGRYVTPSSWLPEDRAKNSCITFSGPSGRCATCYWPAAEHAGVVPHPKDRGCVAFVGADNERCCTFCCLPFKWH